MDEKTNEWNKIALEYAWRDSGSLKPFVREFSMEEIKKQQQKTYLTNQFALDYAKKIRETKNPSKIN